MQDEIKIESLIIDSVHLYFYMISRTSKIIVELRTAINGFLYLLSFRILKSMNPPATAFSSGRDYFFFFFFFFLLKAMRSYEHSTKARYKISH